MLICESCSDGCDIPPNVEFLKEITVDFWGDEISSTTTMYTCTNCGSYPNDCSYCDEDQFCDYHREMLGIGGRIKDVPLTFSRLEWVTEKHRKE
jgi:hypothetical protein